MEGPDPNTPARVPDPALLRVSDDDRHRVAELLREAAGEGRIDLEELDERLEATYAAKTYADLVPITHDLPAPGGHQQPVVRAEPAYAGPVRRRQLALMSGIERRGDWLVPPRLTVMAVLGGAMLDLREARFAASEVVLTVNAFMGGVEIVVGPHTEVVVEGVGIMGGYTGPSRRTPPDPGAVGFATVRVRGVAIMGGVSVVRKPMPGSVRRWLRRT